MDHKLAVIFALVATACAVGLLAAWVLITVQQKIYQRPSNPDEMEQMIELQAAKGMRTYYSLALLIISVLIHFFPDETLRWFKHIPGLAIVFAELANQILRRRMLSKYVHRNP